MKVRPLHDWTIIKRHAPKEISAGGIIIPDAALDIPAEGTVVAIGPGRYQKEPGKKEKFTPTTLKSGQRVYFMEYSTQEIELDGKEVIFIREEDILGTLEDDKQLMVKESHPLEVKREQPLVPHGKAATIPLTPPSEKKVKKKKPAAKKKPFAKKKQVKKEKAVSKTRKPVTKTKAKSKKATKKKTTKPVKKVASKKTSEKTVKKPLKKKTASGTKKKTKTAKKSVKRVAQKPAKGKKVAPKKKSVKVSRKKKR
jgi:chaperonin GroES